MTLTEICRALVAADSTVSNTSLEITQTLCSLAQQLNLNYQVFEEWVDGQNQSNILIFPNYLQKLSSTNDYLLLANHLDTPNSGPLALWKRHQGNPFQLAIEDQTLFGLGIAENKADIAAKLFALHQFSEISSSSKTIPIWLGVFGHQSGMKGMQRWLKKNHLPIKRCLLGAPTQLSYVLNINGYAKVDILMPFSPEEAHLRYLQTLEESTSTSSRLFRGLSQTGLDFDQSSNLIRDVINYFKKLPENTTLIDLDGGTQFNTEPNQILTEIDLSGDLKTPMITRLIQLFEEFSQLHQEFKKDLQPTFQPPHLSFHIGTLRTTESHLRLSGIVRIPPHISDPQIQKWEQAAQTICHKLQANLVTSEFKTCYQLNPNDEIINKAQNIMNQLSIPFKMDSYFMSNEACLIGRKQISTLIFGPGAADQNLHTPNEHVTIKDLITASQVYTSWIKEECV